VAVSRRAHILSSIALAFATSRGGRAVAADEAAPTAARAMSLPDALAYARAHQPSLRAALARVAASAADTRIARAQWQPSFGATAQAFEGTTNNTTAESLGSPKVDLPRIGGTKTDDLAHWSPSTSTLVAVGGSQEIFDFGRIAAQAAVADAAHEGERHRADAERLRVDLMVREAFYGVEGAHAVARAAKDAFARALVHRDMAAASVKSGLHAPIELTRAEADLARFDVGQLRAEGGVLSAETVFAAAVGVDDPLLDAVGAPGAASLAPAVDAAVARALERDPSLREARTRIVGAEDTARAIGAELRPDLALTGTFSGRIGTATPSGGPVDDKYGPLPSVPNWDVGLVLRWPLWDAVVGARRDAAASRAEVARAELATLCVQDIAAVRGAYVDLQIAQATLGSLARAVDAALANGAQADARFKAGLGTSLELADAEALRTDAEIQLAVGRFDVLRARAVLTRLLAEEL
jgi:outer membrane protein